MGPPAGSTWSSQPAPRWTGRPGISRAGRDRASSRPSCRTSSRARRRNSWLRSTNRPRGGAAAARRGSRWARSSAAAAPRHRHGAGTRPGRPGSAGRPRRRGDVPGGVAAAQRGDVGRLGRVHQVAGGEHPGPRSPAPCPPPGRGCPGSMARPGQPGQLVVGDPVPGEHHRVARHEPGRPGAHVRQLDPRQPARARRSGAPRVDVHTGTRQRTAAASRERGVALLPGLVGDQRDHLGAGVRERHHGREADVLGPDDQGPARQPLPVQVDPLLQLAGGHHAGRAVAGDQPGRPRPLPAAGGQQHRRRRRRSRSRRRWSA